MPGLRDILLLLLALAAVYLAVEMVRLMRVGRRNRRPDAQPVEPAVSPGVAAAHETEVVEALVEDVVQEDCAVPPTPTFEWDEVKDLFGEAAGEPALPVRPRPQAAPPQRGFGEALSEHLARSDMETEMERMRDEMERMRREMEEMRTARRVSPQYAEAMELAQRGCTAQDVADRLGISLAEAELVHALSRGRQNFDEGEEDGADGNPGGFDAFGGRRTG